MTTTTRAEPDQSQVDERVERVELPEERNWFQRVLDHPRAVVGTSAVIAGVWAMVGSRLVFPLLSNNHDEAVYLLQANAIEHGHLFPRAGADPEAFLPWLTALEGHRYVPKYAPVFPTMLAIGKWVFTTERATLGLIAAGIIVMVYLLATEVVESRRTAALASVFMLLTPLFIVQAATFLPYSASLLLLTTFAFALLRGLRLRRAGWLVLAGTAVGLAFFARPYDALLFAAPLGIYAIVHYRHDIGALFHNIGWLVVGLIPPAVVMLWFDKAATGHALESPFSLIDSRDTIGFGSRSMDPNNPAVKYTPALGWTGLSRHVMLTMFWVFGGLVLVGCAIFYLVRRNWRGIPTWIGSIAVVLPIGYLFFWGTYGAAVWGAPWYLGPYYYMPIFAPIAILGAGGFVYFLHEFRKVAAFALAGMVVLSGFVIGQAMSKNVSFTQDDKRLNAALTDAHLHNAIVFLPGFYGPRVLHPYATMRNSWDTTGDVLYAVDRGDAEDAAVIADYPGRTPFKVTIQGQYRQNPPDRQLKSVIQPLQIMHGRTVNLGIDFRSPVRARLLSLTITANGRSDTYLIDNAATRGSHEHLDVSVTPRSTTLSGHVIRKTSSVAAGTSDLQVMLGSSTSAAAEPNAFYFRRIGVAQRNGELWLMLPGEEINGFLSPNPLTITAR
jgi:4-amino-4-deoxy-L-arabinose transferase-like glycosyltransferase